MKNSRISWSYFLLVLFYLGGPALGISEPRIKLQVSPGSDIILAGREQIIPLKVALAGGAVSRIAEKRPPVNVCFVFDKSGSMSGDKIRRAKEAMKYALSLLNQRDIISIVAYDDSVDVIVPSTRLHDKERILQKIDYISPGGNTALFAGVSKGVKEIRKFLDRNQVNRVILLSDGLANVGPSQPWQLAQLGKSLRKEGIAVSTIGLGLGYNEDLMTELAGQSDGNHAFVERSSDLMWVFKNEFGDLLNVVAQDIRIYIQCEDDILPVRVIGREADIHGRRVYSPLNQIYSDQEKYILLEIKVPSESAGKIRKLATVTVSYRDLISGEERSIKKVVEIEFSHSLEDVNQSLNKDTYEEYIKGDAIEASEKALELRDKGNVGEAQKVLKKSAEKLRRQAETLGSSVLKEEAKEVEQEADFLDSAPWEMQRKKMKEKQYKQKNQVAW